MDNPDLIHIRPPSFERRYLAGQTDDPDMLVALASDESYFVRREALQNPNTPGWILDPDWSIPTLVIMSLWGVGGGMIIYLAGLQGIPTALYEAAKIDGAGTWHRFRHVTIPMISNVILFNLVMNVIWSFQVFTQALVIGGTTGTPLESTLMVMVLIYRNAFRYFKMGYASAIAFLMFLVIMGITILIFRTSDTWVYTEEN